LKEETAEAKRVARQQALWEAMAVKAAKEVHSQNQKSFSSIAP